MFNKLIFLILLLFNSFGLFGQYFEGKITYQITYKPKIPAMTSDYFSSSLGTIQEYYIKEGDFKTNSNGSMFIWQIYDNAENRLYNKIDNSPNVYWSDGKRNLDEIIRADINTDSINILGYVCNELILTCKNGIYKYYFNSELKVDYKKFEKLKTGNWSDVYALTNAIPLKIISENELVIQESIAIEIKKMTLENSIFQIPKDLNLEKSIY
jgi:hypothetical protein